MENRRGQSIDLLINDATVAEHQPARLRPHIARIEGRKTPGLDGRTTI